MRGLVDNVPIARVACRPDAALVSLQMRRVWMSVPDHRFIRRFELIRQERLCR